MNSFPPLGLVLLIAGGLLVVLGIVFLLAPNLPWFGRLPGDVRIERDQYRVYVPITTSILLSVLLSGLLWAIRCFQR